MDRFGFQRGRATSASKATDALKTGHGSAREPRTAAARSINHQSAGAPRESV